MKEKLLQIAQKLGFGEKLKAKQKLSPEEAAKVAATFKDENGKTIEEAMEEERKNSISTESIDAINSVLGEETALETSANTDTKVQKLVDTVVEQKKTIVTLSNESEPRKPAQVVTFGDNAKDLTRKALYGIHSNTHAFGIENQHFSLENRWNKALAGLGMNTEKYSRAERDTLLSDFENYSKALTNRFAQLQSSGQLGVLMAAGDIDYSKLEADLGKQYLVRRMDAIITYIKKLPSILQYFDIRYNVQDKQEMTDSYAGKSITQSYQPGKIAAGSHAFSPIFASIKKVMFKFKFHDLKELENQYIGYLNREGSHPMKWTFIEWIMVQNSIIQHNEVEHRRINGIRVEPTTGKSQFYMYASTGLIPTIEQMVDEIRAYRLESLKAYDSTTILDYVRSFVRTIFRMVGNLDGMTLYMNALHVPDFREAYRNKYGTDSNFTGEKNEVKDFPNINIIGLPNMGDSMLMFIAKSNMIEFLENKPGEGFAYEYQRDLEELWVTAYKAEGCLVLAGRKFASSAALVLSKGKQTNVFVNYPVNLLAADAASADATVNFMFETIANAAATSFLDFANAVEGMLYTLVCGNLTNATAVAKAAKFANITGAWTPAAVGDYLKVIYNPTANVFWEYSRKVNGVITVNTALVSPEYVESL